MERQNIYLRVPDDLAQEIRAIIAQFHKNRRRKSINSFFEDAAKLYIKELRKVSLLARKQKENDYLVSKENIRNSQREIGES